MSDADELQKLRMRLCRSENVGTLNHLADALDALAEIAPDSMLSDIAALRDRLADKVERLGGRLIWKRPPVEAETFDLTKGDLLLEALRHTHEAPRFDIAPELAAKVPPP
jgi:hypothetical protein